MSSKPQKKLVVILGPTAVGKTSLTINLALEFGVPVINADSRQVYKEMNIGTAKPSLDEMKGVKHYFVDSISLKDNFSAGIFEREALSVLREEFRHSDIALLSGGSGLYIKAVCEGFDNMPDIDLAVREELADELGSIGIEALLFELQQKDPEYCQEVDKSNPQRIIRALEIIRTSGRPYSSFRMQMQPERDFTIIKIGLDRPRLELYERINRRVDLMIEDGLIDEVRELEGYRDTKALQTVGYQEILGFLDEEYDYEEAIRLLKRNSRRFAKRQLTWFRGDDEVTWFNPDELEDITQFIRNQIDN